jgi:hypothetical protein
VPTSVLPKFVCWIFCVFGKRPRLHHLNELPV